MSRIVIFSDGTCASPNKENATNVLVTARTVRPVAQKDKTRQLTFYEAGVGTGNIIDQTITGGFLGGGLNKNVEDAYRFLIHNYVEGDEVFLFGFSRGAYTVRSLVGLIYNVGLLKKDHSDKVGDAIKIYRNRNQGPDSPEAIKFRENCSQDMPIKFLGVWDTVAALGLLLRPFSRLWAWRYGFHDAKLSEIVDHAYQGLAIDERRWSFNPSVWDSDPYKKGEGKRAIKRKTDQIVEQVWFSGVHSDIGGSYDKHGLSDITLRWMTGKARELGLEFDDASIDDFAKGNEPAVINDSRYKWTKLGFAHIREYGVTNAGTESIHHTVIDNHKNHRKGPPPKNLSKYFDSGTLRITDQAGNVALSE